MRAFSRPVCGQRLAFENSACLSCGSALGLSLDDMAMLVIAPGDKSGYSFASGRKMVLPQNDRRGDASRCSVEGAENLSWSGMSSAVRRGTRGSTGSAPRHTGDRLFVGIAMTRTPLAAARRSPSLDETLGRAAGPCAAPALLPTRSDHADLTPTLQAPLARWHGSTAVRRHAVLTPDPGVWR
jgi:hypothetical protein